MVPELEVVLLSKGIAFPKHPSATAKSTFGWVLTSIVLLASSSQPLSRTTFKVTVLGPIEAY